MDAITGTIIQQLSLAVKASVGLKLARMLQTDDKITGVLAEVQVWFREQATPSIFDGIWTRNGVDVKVLNTVSELVNDLPRESSERCRILYSIRDPDLEATGKPFSFKLGDHRVNRALEILLKVTGEVCEARDNAELPEAYRSNSRQMLGLPLASNMTGMAVRTLRKI